jgi:hypothetical protein
MSLAWKFLLPVSLINLFITGVEVLIWPDSFSWMMVIINLSTAAVLIAVWTRVFKPGWSKVGV